MAPKPRIVVHVEGGIVQEILTDGKAADFDIFVHDVDRNSTPDISVSPWRATEVGRDDLQPYTRPHGLTLRQFAQMVECMNKDLELVVKVEKHGVDGDGSGIYVAHKYVALDIQDYPDLPFVVLTIDQSRPIEILPEELL